MDHDNLDFPQAVEELARAAGMEVPREQGRRDQKPRQPTDSPLYPLLDAASEFYRQALRSHPSRKAAVDYLKGRGLSGKLPATSAWALPRPAGTTCSSTWVPTPCNRR